MDKPTQYHHYPSFIAVSDSYLALYVCTFSTFIRLFLDYVSSNVFVTDLSNCYRWEYQMLMVTFSVLYFGRSFHSQFIVMCGTWGQFIKKLEVD